MEFNSLVFFLFFSIFYIVYWKVFGGNFKYQNLFLLAGSYFFYAWFDIRFLLLLVISSLFNYFIAIKIAKTEDEKKRRIVVLIGLIQGLGTLFFFKYFDFFIISIVNAFASIGVHLSNVSLNLVLPLGISFYTFRTISYILDVDNEKIEPTKDWSVFLNYVSFFPSLLAGPIDRATLLIPQLESKRTLRYEMLVNGFRQILWGLFAKLVIADNCTAITNEIFDNYKTSSSSAMVMGAFLYVIQIYADFSGYSNMAIGIGKLLGFNITRNFNYPFFAHNIADFWQRWHMSLTSWMTEYVYTPLSFMLRDYKKYGTILAIIINFILVGLWHGPKWTFILFGLVHGLYFIPLILSGSLNKKKATLNDKLIPSFKEFIAIISTFTIVTFTAVLFKAETLGIAVIYYKSMFTESLFSIPSIASGNLMLIITLFFIFVLIIVEWIGRNQEYGIHSILLNRPRFYRWSFYYFLIISIFIFGVVSQKYVYFKF
jgi:D-alanyl-lipoteichoic acid acyltransferase DltB (MBOAT superfamily)